MRFFDFRRTPYRSAERQSQLFAAFSAFAVSVAGLGLYGLAAHMANRRTKEIGIRKVVGARAHQIASLLSWQFSKPVIMAAPLGIFIAAWAMRDWLDGFAYRISMAGNAWIFAAAVLAAFIIALLSVSSHAVRVTRSNPIEALRHE